MVPVSGGMVKLYVVKFYVVENSKSYEVRIQATLTKKLPGSAHKLLTCNAVIKPQC